LWFIYPSQGGQAEEILDRREVFSR